jgi:hypothetical protein
MSQRFYEIEMLNESVNFDGIDYDKSVKVVQYQAQKKISERFFAFVDKEKIYHWMDAGREIFLDNCYVKDFSLNEYRRTRSIEDRTEVEIKSLHAENAFFDCDGFTDFSYVRFEGDVDFSHTIFSHGSLNFTHTKFKGELNDFSNCSFHSYQTIFQYSQFSGDKLRFENSNFNGDVVSFINASLKSKNVNFKRVNFNQCKVKFHFAEFGDGLKSFEKVKFYGPLMDFRRVLFGSGKIDFRRSLFGTGHITFEESEIKEGKLTFRMSQFEGGNLSFRRMNFGSDEANFDHISYGGKHITFEAATGGRISMTNSDIHATVDMRIKRMDTIDLSETYLHSITDINFSKKESLRQLIILGTRNLGKIIINWKKNNIQELIECQDCLPSHKAEQFNILKDNFSQTGQYDDEDAAYVFFKRYQLQSNYEKSMAKFSFKPGVWLTYGLRSLVFDKMGLYATSPRRVFISMIVALFAFAGIYVMLQLIGLGEITNSVDHSDNLNIYAKSLYHSAITFFTIGYGDYYPAHWCRVFSAIEGWVGVFMMSYFTVAFVRKILR